MAAMEDIPKEVRENLVSCYQEMMYLAARPLRTAANARAWYSAVISGKMASRIRRFSGEVSQASVDAPGGKLVLEHFGRMQRGITGLIEDHLKRTICDPSEFITRVLELEKVRIVTENENRNVQTAQGCYEQAGVDLVNWCDIPLDVRAELWKKKLRGKVKNAGCYRSPPQ